MNLASNPCSACRKDAPVVTAAEIENLMPQLDAAWRIVAVGGVPRLVRVFTVKNFVQAMELAQKVGEMADGEGHHPALLVEWGQLTVSWWTHAILNLHRNDFIMAAKTDRIFSQIHDTSRQTSISDH